ncbi:acyl-CoA N-acyltransferase [Entophlyctis helioformis]|nr:acyl-CoA N-acyltransferase [Entophlyctis helioformis]
MLRGDDPRSRKQPKGDMSDYKFWSTQPVPRTDEEISQDGPIEPNKAPEEIRQEPYPLPKDFEWVTMDLLDPAQLKQVYDLLTLNYVEDDDATLRFDYKAEFLQWAVMSPGWRKEWHVGVRVASTGKLVGFISGIPADLSVHKKSVSLVEINFLCVHKKLRSKRLAPVLIKEITRRVHLFGIFQAVYTAGVYLPKPVGTCRYYHRSLNPKKLVETGFSAIGRNMTMKQMILRYKLPEEPSLPGIRPMVEADVPRVTKLLKQYLGRSGLFPILSQEEVSHWLLPKENVVFSYVVCDPPNSQKVTDFVSFYSLPSSVIGNPKHSSIEAAYLFYYVPRDMGKDVQRTQALIKDALIFARKAGFDVFNCLNEFMDNQSFTEDLKFGKGDGDLHYYLYNYRCRDITAPPSEVMGLLLL